MPSQQIRVRWIPGDAIPMARDDSPRRGTGVGGKATTSTLSSPDQQRRVNQLHASLSDGGEIEMPIADQPWGTIPEHFRDSVSNGWSITAPTGGVIDDLPILGSTGSLAKDDWERR